MAKPKKIKTEPVIPSGKKPKSPGCHIHFTEMVFKPDTGRFECQVTDCKQVAFPPRLVSGSGEPVAGGGELELVTASVNGDLHYFIRSIDDNIMLEVTQFIEGAVTVTSTALRPTEATMTLTFHQVLDLS